jgi:hypothetical protein
MTLLVVLLTAACATTSTRQAVRSEFEDIPVPQGLTYQAERSTIIESPNVKAARLVYRGRVEAASLGIAMRSLLETNGWRPVSATTSSDRALTTQVYEKSGNSLQVILWEGGLFNWYTYLELIASRALAGPKAASQ